MSQHDKVPTAIKMHSTKWKQLCRGIHPYAFGVVRHMFEPLKLDFWQMNNKDRSHLTLGKKLHGRRSINENLSCRSLLADALTSSCKVWPCCGNTCRALMWSSKTRENKSQSWSTRQAHRMSEKIGANSNQRQSNSKRIAIWINSQFYYMAMSLLLCCYGYKAMRLWGYKAARRV